MPANIYLDLTESGNLLAGADTASEDETPEGMVKGFARGFMLHLNNSSFYRLYFTVSKLHTISSFLELLPIDEDPICLHRLSQG